MDKDKNGVEIAECKQRISKCNAQIADNRITIESLEEKIESGNIKVSTVQIEGCSKCKKGRNRYDNQ